MSTRIRRLRNPLLDTLCHLEGNAKPCLLLEPLWGIPYNLYLPFVSVYMAALGLSATEIGLVSTVFFASQMVWALLSGPLTDKLGRRVCTVIFDCLSWSVPALLWMCAQNFWWFLVAAVFNGAWRVTENSWNLLMAEDAPPEKLVHYFSIAHVAGLIAGFVAPIPYLFVQQYTVVPTMRVLYGITFVMMTAKFLILFFTAGETAVGKRRMADTRGVSIFSYLMDSPRVLRSMLRDRRVMLTVGVVACFATVQNVYGTFWPLLVTDKLGIATENLSVFSTLKNILMLLCYFFVAPRIRLDRFERPLLWNLGGLMAVHVLMALLPAGPWAYSFVLGGVVLEALTLSVLSPLTSSLQMVSAEGEERARIMGWFYALCLAVTSPFGVIAGALSEINRVLPMCLNLALLACGLGFSAGLARRQNQAQLSA